MPYGRWETLSHVMEKKKEYGLVWFGLVWFGLVSGRVLWLGGS